jgi:hypothetical protein
MFRGLVAGTRFLRIGERVRGEARRGESKGCRLRLPTIEAIRPARMQAGSRREQQASDQTNDQKNISAVAVRYHYRTIYRSSLLFSDACDLSLFGFDEVIDAGDVAIRELLNFLQAVPFVIFRDLFVLEHLL